MKNKKAIKYFIIDFDSTFIQSEGLEELAKVSLKNKEDKDLLLRKIKEITDKGMTGTVPFASSLKQRLVLLRANKIDLQKTVKNLRKKITSSVKRNIKFFRQFKRQIYIISGGFKEMVVPVVKNFGIAENHVFANTFIFDKSGMITGFDLDNPLAKSGGKVKTIKSLKLKGEIIVVGDGYTDYEVKAMGIAKHFVAFTENVYRESVVKKADQEAGSFDEFLYINKLPMSLSYPKNRIKVLLLENIDNQAVQNFEQEGYKVEWYEKSLAKEVLKNKIVDAKILGIRSRTNLDIDLIKLGQQLLSVGAFCIGTNQINLSGSASAGIAVFNAPYSNTRSVVELIIGEIIMLNRRIIERSVKLNAGIWDKSAKYSHEIRGKVLGIVGYGNIGSQLSVLAETLGMRVYFFDVAEKLALGNAIKCRSLKELLKISDVITVHVDGNKNNANLIGEKEFQIMKEGVIFLNASRGFVVEIKALEKYLRSGKITGAAVDVFPKEPKSSEEKFSSGLQGLANVILTPHIAGSTIEAQKNIGEFVSAKIIDFINTGNTTLSVNFPNILLSKQGSFHRLLHVHNNEPGLLASINSVLAKYKMNIEGQYLKTNEEIGYVITDVNKKYDQLALKELKNIKGTIRFRTLY